MKKEPIPCIECDRLTQTPRKQRCDNCYRKYYFQLYPNLYESHKEKKKEWYYKHRKLKSKPPKERICTSCHQLLKYHCKEMCSKCYQRDYRKEKPEVHRNASKKHYNSNRKKIITKTKNYRLKNKEWYSKYDVSYYNKNKEKILKGQKEFFKNNPEKYIEKKKKNYKHRVEKINELRKKLGLPLINEVNNWISEKTLYELIKYYCQNLTIEYHKKFEWLGRKHIDIFIKEYNLGIEYDGIQHYKYIEYFYQGDYSIFERLQKNDKLKGELCKERGIMLFRWKENKEVNEQNVLKFLMNNNIPFKKQEVLDKYQIFFPLKAE